MLNCVAGTEGLDVRILLRMAVPVPMGVPMRILMNAKRSRHVDRSIVTVLTMTVALAVCPDTASAAENNASALPHVTASTAASPTPASPDPVSPSGDARPSLTPEQVTSQLAEAERLQRSLDETDAGVAAASRRVSELAAQSGALMAQVAQARAAEAAAAKDERAHRARLKQLSDEADDARHDVHAMAYQAYINGVGGLTELAAMLDLVADDAKSSREAATADLLADARAAEEKRFRALARLQQVTARKAADAKRQREQATQAAVAAQAKTEAKLKEQQRALAELQTLAHGQRRKLTALGVAAVAPPTSDAAPTALLSIQPLCSNDNRTYPNGQLPPSALCPITRSPGHAMRPAAARALNSLKSEYARAFGTQLCITDSYRTLAAQIDVKARKPLLAATPGTSQHGLGLAVDLCGGIESFGTPQHLWMQQHAPMFGFFHPAWAEPTGSKPEPWHWEYGL